MNREAVEIRVRSVVAQQMGLPLSEVRLESRLVADLGTDSLDHILMVTDAEEACGVVMAEHAVDGITTVGELVEVIEGVLRPLEQAVKKVIEGASGVSMEAQS